MWADIPGYEGIYQVSRIGQVRRAGTGKLIKPTVFSCGYCYVSLTKDKVATKYRVHRLVAFCFVSNPNDKPHVNHLDGVKTNNRADNLEWCTPSENIHHRHDVLGQTPAGRLRSVAVTATSEDGSKVLQFASLHEAQRNGFIATNISKCLRGERQTHLGFKWEAAA
jgi:hypothetical protein